MGNSGTVYFVWCVVMCSCLVAVWSYFYPAAWWITSAWALMAGFWAVMFMRTERIVWGYEALFAKRKKEKTNDGS